MCQSCIDIDKKIEEHRRRLTKVADPAEIERINQLIFELYGERVRSHKNPER